MVRFEIRTLEIGYRQNFAKIRKLILYGLKCLNLDIWASNFPNYFKFEISTFEIGSRQNFVKIRKLILFVPKCPYFGIGAHTFRKSMSDLKSAHST